MSPQYPELIFVAGDQAGERVTLTTPTAVLGRSHEAEIYLSESYASRRHVQFELTSEGWVVENLSPAGTLINDKTYKAGKRILLDTGDVLGIGEKTRILFVGPGDDADATLAGYTLAHPQDKAPSEATSETPDVDSEQVEATGPIEHVTAKTQPIKPLTEKADGSKVRKYLIFAAVYMVVLGGAAVFLSGLKSEQDKETSQKRLTKADIAEALTVPLEKARNPNQAAQMLRDAKQMYPGDFNPGDQYRCFKSFKLHLAYRGGRDFEDPVDAQKFRSVRDELIERMAQGYNNAYALEKANQFSRAEIVYRSILKMLPETDSNDQVYKKLIKHIRQRVAYINRQKPKGKRR